MSVEGYHASTGILILKEVRIDMPHAWVEYSKNIEAEEEIKTLGRAVYDAMIETGIFPVAGIRVRVNCIENYLVGDLKEDRSFVHLSIRIGEGRTDDVKAKAADLIFKRLSDHLKPLADRVPLAFAFIMEEIPGKYSYKMNNLRNYIK
jgi:5-carboxymethyl-2-hydroxymuconate isomerase